MFVQRVRHAEGSTDQELLFVFAGNRMLVRAEDARARLPERRELDAAALLEEPGPLRRLPLGSLDGRPCTAIELSRERPALPAPLGFRDLRSLLGALDDELMRVAGIASQVLDWDRNHRHCGRCGALTVASATERSRNCPSCSLTVYPRISPAIIVAVMQGNRILLAHNRRHSAPVYSILAGFVEPGESLEECVRREVMEEVAIELGEIRYFGSQPWPFPDSLMIGFVADFARGEIRADGEEILEAGWFDRDTVPQIPPHGTIARRIIDSVLGSG